MAANLIDLIKELRERTGAGLMDCKGALLANDCDLDKASDYLREKGLAKAAKKASRIAAEGLFRELVDAVADIILAKRPANVEEAKELTSELFADATVKMGEKFDLRRFDIFDSEDSAYIASYIHMGGKIAVAVALDKEDAELGKGLAMHIAANNPQYLSLNDVAPSEVAHEKEVQLEAAKNDPKLAGKPAEMLAKIIDAKVTKYYSEMVLGSQVFLMDDSKTVAQALKEKGVNVLRFVRYQVGEGIEKRKDDFASEVMNEVNK